MLYLDHIIWTGDNIEKVSNQYGKDFAVKSVKGGEHEDWGTFNYLTHMSNNCYLEWLGIRDMKRAEMQEMPLIQHLTYALNNGIHGPFQFALRTNKINAYIDHFKQNDIPFTGPFVGERRKPNGQLLSWRMVFPHGDYKNGEVIPFLIEWDQPEHKRVDVSLINHQAITDIYLSGVTKDRFSHIFHLPNKKLGGNKIKLPNTRIHFTDHPDPIQMKLS